MMEKFLMFFFGMYAARCCALRGCAFEAFFDFAFLLPFSDEDGGGGDVDVDGGEDEDEHEDDLTAQH